MIVRRAAAGSGIGAFILDWAANRAAKLGRKWIRLDAWRSNQALQTYYKRQGFTHVRTVTLPSRKSGVLFQRETTPR